jgi:hypothetical protein
MVEPRRATSTPAARLRRGADGPQRRLQPDADGGLFDRHERLGFIDSIYESFDDNDLFSDDLDLIGVFNNDVYRRDNSIAVASTSAD